MSGNHPTSAPIIYLAGSIRDNDPRDINWREQVMIELRDRAVFLNPLGGKVFNPETGIWTVSGMPAIARTIVKHDLWCVRKCDIVLANLTSLSEGYPSIGTLMELGAAAIENKLIYAIQEPGLLGHQNKGMFKLHPFLAELTAEAFTTVEDAIRFLRRHLNVLSGAQPQYDGALL